ncbi:MAG: hypothetical protein ACTSQY_07130, partial [Candidatus Odinarchaeia archaeon]
SIFGISIGHAYLIFALLSFMRPVKDFFMFSKRRWIITPIAFFGVTGMFFALFSYLVANPDTAGILFIYFRDYLLLYFSFIWLIIQVISLSFLFRELTPPVEASRNNQDGGKLLVILAPLLGYVFTGIAYFTGFIHTIAAYINSSAVIYVTLIILLILVLYTTVFLVFAVIAVLKNKTKFYKFLPIFYMLSLLYMFYQLGTLYINVLDTSGVGVAIIDIAMLLGLTFYSLQSIGFKLISSSPGKINEMNSMFLLFAVVMFYLVNICVTIITSINEGLSYIIGSASSHLALFIISPLIFASLFLVLVDYKFPKESISIEEIQNAKV